MPPGPGGGLHRAGARSRRRQRRAERRPGIEPLTPLLGIPARSRLPGALSPVARSIPQGAGYADWQIHIPYGNAIVLANGSGDRNPSFTSNLLLGRVRRLVFLRRGLPKGGCLVYRGEKIPISYPSALTHTAPPTSPPSPQPLPPW